MTLGRQEHEGCGLGCEAEAWAPGQHLVWVGRDAALRVHALYMHAHRVHIHVARVRPARPVFIDVDIFHMHVSRGGHACGLPSHP